MATNLALDNELILQAVEVGGHRTKKEAVTAALQEYIAARNRLGILEMFGKVEYFDDHDPKALRRCKTE